MQDMCLFVIAKLVRSHDAFQLWIVQSITLPVLLRIANQHANLLSHLASTPVYIGILLISLAILALSLFASVQIFQKTDLQ